MALLSILLSVLLSILLAVLAVVFLLPTVSDLVSLTMLRAAGDTPPAGEPAETPRVLILIPAHDEELLIDACLASLDALQYPRAGRDVLVVADNCADATAARVRARGVTCLERTDSARRGKPWAVAWALERVTLAEYDGVVVLDADTIVDSGFLRALARRAPLGSKVVQGYIDVSNPEESAVTRMARVWSTVRFQVINRLKLHAGLNVPLGDGLCIGTGVLAQYGWSAFSLSETWEVYASMTAVGVRCVGASDAHLGAQEARSLSQSASQRKRWTAGRLTVLARYGPAILASRQIGLRQKLDSLAELTALGPAAHLGAASAFAVLAVVSGVPFAAVIAAALLASLARPITYTVIALARDPAPGRAVAAFAFLPLYVIWRLGIQVSSFARLGHKPWVRTVRHQPAPQPDTPPSSIEARERNGKR
jgi:cellulose synthase/poly-beta-1,6-N-acetylglucosamine synthase-like glycosyltransferase